jgi:hypothetical protein
LKNYHFIGETSVLANPPPLETAQLQKQSRRTRLQFHTEDCGWTYLNPIYPQVVSIWYGANGLQNAGEADFKSNGLHYSLQSAIPAYGTVSGWWFFESTKKCNASIGSKVSYRISLSTFNDMRFEYTSPEMAVATEKDIVASHGEGRTSKVLLIFPDGKRDISGFYRVLGGASGGYRVKPN